MRRMAQICAMPDIAAALIRDQSPLHRGLRLGQALLRPGAAVAASRVLRGRAPFQNPVSSSWRRDQAPLDLATGGASKSKASHPCATWRTLPNPEWRIGTASEVAAARWNRLAEALARRPPG